jgi:hypothetical protein
MRRDFPISPLVLGYTSLSQPTEQLLTREVPVTRIVGWIRSIASLRFHDRDVPLSSGLFLLRGHLGSGRLFCVLALLIPPTALRSQTTPGASPSAQGTPPTSSVAQATVGSQTYSVEGDILAYKALQSDSEAIACDVAGALPGGATTTPEGSNPVSGSGKSKMTDPLTVPCTVAPSVTAAHVLIISSTDQTLSNYQLWRIAMLTVDTLLTQAHNVTPAAAVNPASVVGVDTAISSVISIMQTLAGFFVSNEAVGGIQGTPQDQALVDDVARHLRFMGVHVFVPNLYSPFAFNGLDYRQSPFLAKLAQLQVARTKLAANLALLAKLKKDLSDANAKLISLQDEDKKLVAEHKPRANEAKIRELMATVKALNAQIQPLDQASLQMTAVLQSIDSFNSGLVAASNSAINPPPSPTSGSPTAGGGSTPTTVTPPTPTTPAAPAIGNPTPVVQPQAAPATPVTAVAPIVSILYGDGVARALGATAANTMYDPTTGTSMSWNPDSSWRVLSLKNLETGATVVARSNFFGTKVWYGGGAIATYMIFGLDGSTYCSADVFDYGGRVRWKDFDGKFRTANIDPSKQLLFFRGRCSQ